PIVAKTPGLRRYIISPTLPEMYEGGATPDFDGIAELWFDDSGVMRALARTAEYAAVEADQPNFIDARTMGFIVTEEHIITEGPTPPGAVKNVEFIARKPGMSVEEFQRYWREVHGPLAASIPVLRRYVQSHTRRSAYEGGRTPTYDGVALTWFDDTSAMRVSATTPEYARVRADEANFLAPVPSPFIIATEHVILP
ncbi:MAG TPA: EthD family reductase, partial [Methylomirabilota bacterium]|nr:EthD family reductase [Methylomirabilota bacterium]